MRGPTWLQYQRWAIMGALTVRQIEAAKATGKLYFLSDGRGLFLCIGPDGSKTWLVRVSINGKQHDKPLGKAWGRIMTEGRLSLEEARAAAATIRSYARAVWTISKRISVNVRPRLKKRRQRSSRSAICSIRGSRPSTRSAVRKAERMVVGCFEVRWKNMCCRLSVHTRLQACLRRTFCRCLPRFLTRDTTGARSRCWGPSSK
ncbi:DUF4102 domain-containing protein [Burkholderia contaminans]|nr:DUF4102 domain-containing protein [Burkholderia contaminans]